MRLVADAYAELAQALIKHFGDEVAAEIMWDDRALMEVAERVREVLDDSAAMDAWVAEVRAATPESVCKQLVDLDLSGGIWLLERCGELLASKR